LAASSTHHHQSRQLSLQAKCLTKPEATKLWPKAHLYWHGEGRCWDNNAVSKASRDQYEPRRQSRESIARVLQERDKAAQSEVISDLDRAAPSAPPAEIAFPTVVRSNEMAQSQLQIPKPVPWFNPHSMTSWPQVYDIDEPDGFTEWRKRIE
jgi:hypothetical protein